MSEDDFSKIENPYEVFGVNKEATEEEIKKVWIAKSLEFHPNSTKKGKKNAGKFMRLKKAYDVLKNKDRRAELNVYLQNRKNSSVTGSQQGTTTPPPKAERRTTEKHQRQREEQLRQAKRMEEQLELLRLVIELFIDIFRGKNKKL